MVASRKPRPRSTRTRSDCVVETLETRVLLTAVVPDINFGYKGYGSVQIGGPNLPEYSDMAIGPDGSIVEVGTLGGTASGNVPLAIRYSSNGTPDVTFIDNAATIPITSGFFTRVTVQPDLKTVAVGYELSGLNPYFVVARFNQNGTPDSTFGFGGEETIPFTDNNGNRVDSTADGVVVLPNGNIVVGITVDQPVGESLALLALSSTGGRVDNFGASEAYGGLVQILTGTKGSLTDVGMDSNGNILVTGDYTISTSSGAPLSGFVARYSGAGLADTSFNGTGIYTIPAGTSGVSTESIASDSQGRVYVHGYGNGNDLVERFTSAGQPDSTFGSGGVAYTGLNSSYGLAVQSDGSVLTAGEGDIVRITPSGTLDPTFGIAGTGVVSTSLSNIDPETIALDASGGIIAGGLLPSGNDPSAVGRFISEDLSHGGVLDPTFAGVGEQTLAGTSNITINAEAVQPDGKIVVAGGIDATSFGRGEDSYVARYNADGTLDSSFTPLELDFHAVTDIANAVLVLPNGNILVAGETAGGIGGGDMSFAIADSNGSFNTEWSYNFPGNSTDGVFSMALQPDGKVVVAGLANAASNGLSTLGQIGVLRMEPQASSGQAMALDTGFGSGGFVAFSPASGVLGEATSVALDPGGDIIVGAQDANNEMVVARLQASNGALDPYFGSGGIARIAPSGQQALISALAIQPDGRIVVGGQIRSSGASTGDWNFLAARLAGNGLLDSSSNDSTSPFAGGAGYESLDVSGHSDDRAYGLALQSDGKIVLSGVTNNPAIYQTLCAMRLNSNGSRDIPFGPYGSGFAEAVFPYKTAALAQRRLLSTATVASSLPAVSRHPPAELRPVRLRVSTLASTRSQDRRLPSTPASFRRRTLTTEVLELPTSTPR